MRGLTIWQPFASLILAGAKPYEFRNWPAPKGLIGQRIVIHAAARPVRMEEMNELQETAHSTHGISLGGSWEHLAKAFDLIDEWQRAGCKPDHFPLAAGLGTAILGEPVRCVDLFFGTSDTPYEIDEDKWAWPLVRIETWPEPVPARGYQGFWPWEKGRQAAA